MAMAILQPLSHAGSPEADVALDRMSARIGYRPNALATMARRPQVLVAVLSLVEQVIFAPGASPVGLRWMAAYATCVGASCGYSGTHAAHGAVEAGEALSRFVAAAYSPEGGGFGPGEQIVLKMAGANGGRVILCRSRARAGRGGGLDRDRAGLRRLRFVQPMEQDDADRDRARSPRFRAAAYCRNPTARGCATLAAPSRIDAAGRLIRRTGDIRPPPWAGMPARLGSSPQCGAGPTAMSTPPASSR